MALVLSSSALTVPPSPTSRTPPGASPFAGNFDLVQQWDEATVGEWLKSVNCGKYRQQFASNNINGDALLDCDQNILKEVGVTKVGDRIRIMVAVKALRTHAASFSKVYNLVVFHGTHEFRSRG
jgi:mitogen-activated protein kinase kinase kinase